MIKEVLINSSCVKMAQGVWQISAMGDGWGQQQFLPDNRSAATML
jgi:hypothetical protein